MTALVVGDIKIVAIPRYVQVGLFGDCTANLLWARTCTPATPTASPRGTAPMAAIINSPSRHTRACSSICFWRSLTTGA
jgi:hypothetical protein